MGLDLVSVGVSVPHVRLNLLKALLLPFLWVLLAAKHIHALLLSWGWPSSSG